MQEYALCYDCMYASALHFQQQQVWILKQGDPVAALRKEVAALKTAQIEQTRRIQQLEADN